MTADTTPSLVERLKALSALEDGWYANVGRKTGEACCAAMREAAARIVELEAALKNPLKHDYWRAGEPDCPKDIKAGNGELHTLRCKRCGLDSPRDQICRAASNLTTKEADRGPE